MWAHETWVPFEKRFNRCHIFQAVLFPSAIEPRVPDGAAVQSGFDPEPLPCNVAKRDTFATVNHEGFRGPFLITAKLTESSQSDLYLL